MKLSHRALTQNDLERICTFPQSEEELFYISPKSVYPLTPEQVWNTAQERHSPTVVYDADTLEVLAYSNLYDLNAGNSSVWLGNVMVAPESRGRGVAEYLLHSMMDQAKKEYGVSRLRLYCHNPNTRALMFYLKHGFVPNGGYKVTENTRQQKIVGIEMERKLDV